jgi:hypothetical protein
MEIIDNIEYLTIEEVSRKLEKTSRMVFQYIHSGKLKSIKKGRRVYVEKSSIENHLDELKKVEKKDGISRLKSESLNFNPETHVLLDKEEYQSLLVNLGIQQERIRNLESEVKRLEYTPIKLPWWKKIFSRE